MRIIFVLLLLAVSACTSQTHELPRTTKSDPIWQLNEGKWTFNENKLTSGATP